MITVNCQSSIKITGEKTIYCDPLNVEEKYDADLILITHSHWDHFSKEDILKVKRDITKIIGPNDIRESLVEMGFKEENIITTTPYQEVRVDNILIKTVPAYNKEKNYHPKENKWLGYLLTMDNKTYYIMGDTDCLEENEKIQCDILCIPIGGTYTMDASEAAQFTNIIHPKKVIPIHYGLVVGNAEDLAKFKNEVSDTIAIEELIK